MVVKEHLSWILDHPKWKLDEKYRRNIEIAHSLGLKCDCVGWSSLDLTRPDAGEILDRIEAFCKEEGWLARGGCSHWCEDFESDWYELLLPELDDTEHHMDERFERGYRRDVYAIRAYKNKNQPAFYGCLYGEKVPLVVSGRFREACIRHNIPGLRFCWIRDVGRYASEPYFFMYSSQSIPKIACDYGLQYSDELCWYYTPQGGEYRHDPSLYFPHGPGSEIYDRVTKIGGKLPRVAEIFYKMQFAIQDYYPKNEMPKSGFVYIGQHYPDWYRDKALIHKDTAELLIQEKVLSRKHLSPALLYGSVPPGYVEVELQTGPVPEDEHFAQMQSEYEVFIKVSRPVRRTTPKEAVKLLRKAKTARKADFQKRMKKEVGEVLGDTAYAPLAPYYLVADGGDLSDEYCLLSYVEAQAETAEFVADMAKEELLDQPIEGIAFVRCADGDRVILRSDGTVVQVSHEVPEIIEDWPTLAQFFADCVELEEE